MIEAFPKLNLCLNRELMESNIENCAPRYNTYTYIQGQLKAEMPQPTSMFAPGLTKVDQKVIKLVKMVKSIGKVSQNGQFPPTNRFCLGASLTGELKLRC